MVLGQGYAIFFFNQLYSGEETESLWFECELLPIGSCFECLGPSSWQYFEGCEIFRRWGLDGGSSL